MSEVDWKTMYENADQAFMKISGRWGGKRFDTRRKSLFTSDVIVIRGWLRSSTKWKCIMRNRERGRNDEIQTKS